jgi:hypothetical protein
LKKNGMHFAIFGLLILTSSIGEAAASETALNSQSPLSSELKVVGIDDAVAQTAGNKVLIKDGFKILIDGATGSEITRIRVASIIGGFGPAPLNAVAGNCGTSYLYMQNLGSRKYQFSTGFDLTVGKARDFSWQILINSQWNYPNTGSYNFQWSDAGPMLLSAHWTSGWKVDQTTAPYGSIHVGRVMKGIVFRSDGVICTSGYPTANISVY